jgi:hypothetical protein
VGGQDSFMLSSRSVGVCGSRKKDIKRVIIMKRNSKKQQYKYNFTWTSQSCELSSVMNWCCRLRPGQVNDFDESNEIRCQDLWKSH